MAAALVGGAFLSATLQVLFDRLASRQVLNFFKHQNLNIRLLKKLEIMMITVDKVLNDAEGKQISDLNVKRWVNELKHAAYEAEDFLDEIDYEAQRLEVEADSQTSSDQEMESRLEEILDVLQFLVQQKDALGLRDGIGEKASAQKMPTTSLLDEHDVYGRDDDKEAIMKLVLSEDANDKQLDVIPIVGMGGVGKTTLAQLIYNDSRVHQMFDLKAWVYVSEDFEVLKLTKDILEEVGSATCESMNANRLHCELEKETAGKKIVLVFDDVWSDNQQLWDTLLIPFKSVRQGSKIIVTTRNDIVASVKSTVPTHHLQKLTEDDCWLVFEKQAFDDGSSSAHPDLVEIGREIVRKSNGLPLAAKALGGLLRSKRDVKEWEKVLKCDIWNSPKDPVLPALTLSYYHLPSQLKQCFSYCAIFPKGYRFDKDELIRLWMAEGFVVPLKGYEEIDDVGDKFFHDLASRSFFQRYSSHNPPLFIMHDLIHDLAKFVSGEFCFLLEDDDSNKIAKQARHFSYVPTRYDASQKFVGIYEAEFLRTFISLSEQWKHYRIEDKIIHDLLPRLRRLRVLSLSRYSSVAKLSDSMGKLKHLRYLNLSRTSIEELSEVVCTAYNLQTLVLKVCNKLVKLPDSICNLKHLRYVTLEETKIKRLPQSMSDLYNLQTLILQSCSDLIDLPTGMERLINLCHLDIQRTKLLEMPSGMGKLTKLKKLTDFFVGKQSGSSIKELGKLQHLQGSLCIWNLQNVMNVEDAAEANLKGKKQIEGLQLVWDGDTEDSQHERNVLEKLEPHTNLKYLRVDGYGGTRFPDWMGPMGNFTYLHDLSILNCPNIISFPQEGFAAPNLTKLKLDKCTKLKWLPERMHFLLPSLEELQIHRCPEVESFPEGGLPSALLSLSIINCNKLIQGRMQWNLQSHPSLTRFTIGNDEEMESFPEDTLLPSTLTSLSIFYFKNLKALNRGIQHLTSLKQLDIRTFQKEEN